MAQTIVNTNSRMIKYQRDYFKEFVRESGFSNYMGTGYNNPFVVKNELIAGGQVINIPLVAALNGDGTGTGTLSGNEEALRNYSYDVKPYWHRNAVKVDRNEAHVSSFDPKSAAREMLKFWDMDQMRFGIINGLSAVAESSAAYNAEDGHPKQVFMSEATAAQKNAWCAANEKRVLFGVAESNYNATFATALATVDAAADRFLGTSVNLMKVIGRRRDRTNNIPSLRPIRVNGGREYFVLFTGSGNFARLKADLKQTNADARPRDVDSNPIFQDGDLLWDGVIVREIPEIEGGTAAGLAANVEPAYLCGAQALAIAWGQKPRATEDMNNDYGFQHKKGTESLWAAEKLIYNGLDHGVVTGFFYTA